MNEAELPLPRPECPACSTTLELQQHEPLVYWCAICRKWFNEKLERMLK